MSKRNIVVRKIFREYLKVVEDEQIIRENIRLLCKDCYRISAEMATALQVIHHSDKGIATACIKVKNLFGKAKEAYKKIQDAVPPGQYFRFHDHWRKLTQRYCFHISLTFWLESGTLTEHSTIAEILGLAAEESSEGFHLDQEDYLQGILLLCAELPRMLVNMSARRNYRRAAEISKFVHDVDTGFRLLNMKNDGLRRRYDGLKYHVKKIEGIIYDLNLRNLLPTEPKVKKLEATKEEKMQEDVSN